MRNINIEVSRNLGESTYITTLENGLKVYICKKKGFNKKIGIFGTKYGSLDNDFIDIRTRKRIKVPDGIAHFLEHKLFENQKGNALDMFSEIGVDSNAYTSFDRTIYYFETSNRFEEAIDILIKMIKEPYFTDENVAKEQGIISQEISKYDDDTKYTVYYNLLRAMYQKNPIRVNIAGTIESISYINKELLYTCYNTFYSPQNMFILVIGDVDVNKTIELIDNKMKKYDGDITLNEKIKKFIPDEPKDILQKEITQKLDIYMPRINIGYKLPIVDGEETTKCEVISYIISEMYFSTLSDFFQKEYSEEKIDAPVDFYYEGGDTFSHVVISATSKKIDLIEEDILNYIEDIKEKQIDEELFNIVKRNIIGNIIFSSESLSSSGSTIIESILRSTSVYKEIEVLESITSKDIKDFLNKLDERYRVSSKIISKE